MSEAIDWIPRLGLQRHPEGGWYRRIYTAETSVETPQGTRPLATSIHYLLDRDEPIGRLHRNRSGILHFLQHGGPVEYLVVAPAGVLERTVLGFGAAEALSLHVPGGCWKASRLLDPARHALVSEVVAPGFDFADHRFIDRATVLREHPQHLAALAPFLRE